PSSIAPSQREGRGLNWPQSLAVRFTTAVTQITSHEQGLVLVKFVEAAIGGTSRKGCWGRARAPAKARSEAGASYEPSSSFSGLWRNLTSSGLGPGPPAKWPQIDGTGRNFALGMLATSNLLSSGGK